jgi:hypothetical protein
VIEIILQIILSAFFYITYLIIAVAATLALYDRMKRRYQYKQREDEEKP